MQPTYAEDRVEDDMLCAPAWYFSLVLAICIACDWAITCLFRIEPLVGSGKIR